MGGAGTWELLTRYRIRSRRPCRFAAMRSRLSCARQKDVPVWAFHAEDDPPWCGDGYYHSPHGAVGGARVWRCPRCAPPATVTRTIRSIPRAKWKTCTTRTRTVLGRRRTKTKKRWSGCSAKRALTAMKSSSSARRVLLYGGLQQRLHVPGGGQRKGAAYRYRPWRRQREKMAESLTSLPVELAVTHAHIDHLLSGDVFEKYYMSKKDVPLLPRLNERYGQEFYGKGRYRHQRRRRHRPWRRCENGSFRGGGHTPGSVVFIDRAHKCLFTGDAFGLWAGAACTTDFEYKAAVLRLKEKLQKPGYTELAFLGGHRRQGGRRGSAGQICAEQL